MKLFPALRMFRSGANISRKHMRHACLMPATLYFLDHGFKMDGFVNEVSLGGARFRPSQTYLMRRQGAIIRIMTEEFNFDGILRNTSAQGYGIEFRHPIHEDKLDDLLAKYPRQEATAD